ncbi:hypothetical protein FE74_15460, partial [Staphylococcus aureus]
DLVTQHNTTHTLSIVTWNLASDLARLLMFQGHHLLRTDIHLTRPASSPLMHSLNAGSLYMKRI